MTSSWSGSRISDLFEGALRLAARLVSAHEIEVDGRVEKGEGPEYETAVMMGPVCDVYDLAATVQPGATYNFSVSMIAPYNTGTYGEMWEVGMGSKVMCQFYVYITVP